MRNPVWQVGCRPERHRVAWGWKQLAPCLKGIGNIVTQCVDVVPFKQHVLRPGAALPNP